MRSAVITEFKSPTSEVSDASAVLLGESAATRSLRRIINRVARADVTVLITGETGTGKELVARCLHLGSPHSQGPFVAVNCAAIPASLLEAEFFGYERGAFTGAAGAKAGRFERAQGGTLFLDEIGDMPIELQAKLLRVLQERSFERIGGTQSIPVECCIVAATHADLPKAIAEGRFREDLYYRLNVVPLQVPALRDRPADVLPIARHAIQRLHEVHGTRLALDDQAIRALTDYAWPGNVRELTNLLERLAILFGDQIVTAPDLWPHLNNRASQNPGCGPGRGAAPQVRSFSATPSAGPAVDLRSAVAQFEADLINQALTACGGNVTRAAARLGVPRTTLVEKVRRLHVGREPDADPDAHHALGEPIAAALAHEITAHLKIQPQNKEMSNDSQTQEVLHLNGGRVAAHGVRRHDPRMGAQGPAAVGLHRWRPSPVSAR
jgi:transcriptional regulator with PAS, ATPase and Fis domain